MSDREEYNKFWETFTEKVGDILREYNKLSDENKRLAYDFARTVVQTTGIVGLVDLIKNPPKL